MGAPDHGCGDHRSGCVRASSVYGGAGRYRSGCTAGGPGSSGTGGLYRGGRGCRSPESGVCHGGGCRGVERGADIESDDTGLSPVSRASSDRPSGLRRSAEEPLRTCMDHVSEVPCGRSRSTVPRIRCRQSDTTLPNVVPPTLGSGSGMRLIVHGPQPFDRHVSVDLGGRQRRVTEQLLHHSQIGSSLEEVSCRGVT